MEFPRSLSYSHSHSLSLSLNISVREQGGRVEGYVGRQGEKVAKERCNGVVGESLGCKERQRLRHGGKEVGAEAGGHCIKDNVLSCLPAKIHSIAIFFKILYHDDCSNSILVQREYIIPSLLFRTQIKHRVMWAIFQFSANT